MILLTSTSDLLQIITSAAVETHVHASWVDNAAGIVTPGRTNTKPTTATTTTIVAAPATSVQRRVRLLTVDAYGGAQTVSVLHTDGTNAMVLFKCALLSGESLEYTDGQGFRVFDASGNLKTTGFPLGSNWAAALIADAHSGAANGVDAGTVSGYGIGTSPPLKVSIDLNTCILPGFYAFQSTCTHNPTSVGGVMTVRGYSNGTTLHQEVTVSSTLSNQRSFLRTTNDGGSTWGEWYEIWNATSDSNGGQPPAPKTAIQGATKAQNAYASITGVPGSTYIAYVWNASQGGGASAILIDYAGTMVLVCTLATHANCSIVLSGQDVRFTNLYAGSCTIYYALVQIGW